jgi:hypothetical protein
VGIYNSRAKIVSKLELGFQNQVGAPGNGTKKKGLEFCSKPFLRIVAQLRN